MATAELGSEKVFGFLLPKGSNGELIKQSILSVLTALFLLTIFFLFVFPRFADLAESLKKVKDLETKSDNLIKTIEVLDSFGRDIDENAKQSVFLAIPTKFDPGYILISLRKLSQDNKVSLVSYNLAGGEISDSAVKSGGAAIPHVVRLEIAGPAENLIGFVDNLDSYLPIASVSELSISEISRVIISQANESKLSMSLAFYHMPFSIVTADSLAGRFLTPEDLANVKLLSTYKRLGTFSTGTGVPTGGGKENLFGL